MSFWLRWHVTLEASCAGVPYVPLKTRHPNRRYPALSDCAGAGFPKDVVSRTKQNVSSPPGRQARFPRDRASAVEGIGGPFGSIWVPSRDHLGSLRASSGRRWRDQVSLWEVSGRLGKPMGRLGILLGLSGHPWEALGSFSGASGEPLGPLRLAFGGTWADLGGPRALSEASGSFWAHGGFLRRAWKASGDSRAGSRETREVPIYVDRG